MKTGAARPDGRIFSIMFIVVHLDTVKYTSKDVIFPPPPPPTRVIIHSAFTIADFLFDEASLPQRKIDGRPRWTACLRHVVAVAASPIENKFRNVQRGVLSRGLYGSYAFPRIRHREEKSPERELTSVPLIAELRDAPPPPPSPYHPCPSTFGAGSPPRARRGDSLSQRLPTSDNKKEGRGWRNEVGSVRE